MGENKEILAKKAYIEYAKLQQLRRDVETLTLEVGAINLSVQRYNEILTTAKNVVSEDQELLKSIEGLKSLKECPRTLGGMSASRNKAREITVESGVLLAILDSFIRWYLPVEKQRTIGFRSDEAR